MRATARQTEYGGAGTRRSAPRAWRCRRGPTACGCRRRGCSSKVQTVLGPWRCLVLMLTGYDGHSARRCPLVLEWPEGWRSDRPVRGRQPSQERRRGTRMANGPSRGQVAEYPSIHLCDLRRSGRRVRCGPTRRIGELATDGDGDAARLPRAGLSLAFVARNCGGLMPSRIGRYRRKSRNGSATPMSPPCGFTTLRKAPEKDSPTFRVKY